MNAPLTRRSLLGATASLGAVALPTACPALASPAEAMSPEATALLREFHDVAGRFNAAGDRLDQAQRATAPVREPEALFARGQDFWLLGCIAPVRHWTEPRFHYGTDELVAKLRDLPAGDGDRRRADRRDEIVAAWNRWQADKEAAQEASGEAAASDHYRAAGDEHDAFVLRLVHTRTADPNVMRIKAAVVLNIWRDAPDRFDGLVERVAEAEGDVEDALCFSLMRDMLHGLGAEYRVAL